MSDADPTSDECLRQINSERVVTGQTARVPAPSWVEQRTVGHRQPANSSVFSCGVVHAPTRAAYVPSQSRGARLTDALRPHCRGTVRLSAAVHPSTRAWSDQRHRPKARGQ